MTNKLNLLFLFQVGKPSTKAATQNAFVSVFCPEVSTKSGWPVPLPVGCQTIQTSVTSALSPFVRVSVRPRDLMENQKQLQFT